MRLSTLGLLVALALGIGLCGPSRAAIARRVQVGTAAQAKAMLARAVAAVQADKAHALELFNKGEDGFKYHDLQPFCFNVSDGTITAAPVPQLLGIDIRGLKDNNGKEVGQAIYHAATEGKITKVSYLFPHPRMHPTPFQKASLITRVGDQGCGVSYFK